MGNQPQQIFSDEDLLAILDQHRHPDGRPNSSALAAAFGVRRVTIQSRLAKLARQGRLGLSPVLPGMGITQTATQIVDEKGQKVWVQTKPVSEAKLELEPGEVYEKRSVLTDGDFNTKLIWHKLKPEDEQKSLTREAIQEMVAEWKGKSEILAAPRGCDPNRLAFYPTADLHNGLLSWGKDSGKDWDLELAEKHLLSATSELIQLTPPAELAILFDVGDQFHMNDQTNATPKNRNRLDVDGRFPKVVKTSVKMRRSMISLALQRHQRVIYRGVRGNHDPEAQFWLSVALAEHYENDPRVEIDVDPDDFFFYEFGETFLCGNHGDKVKPDELPLIMASDRKEIWGRTTYRYCFSGHIHKERSGERMGVRWETLRTPTPGDNFSHTAGYRSGHELTSITYSAQQGQRHRQFVPV